MLFRSNILTDGTVYYVKTINSGTTFTMSQTLGGSTFNPGTGSGNMAATVGGQPSVRITTASAHNLSENDLVIIDGVNGSTQLNNNLYYAKIINSTQFDIYTQPYDPAFNAINYPVLNVNSYVSGGYVGINGGYVL